MKSFKEQVADDIDVFLNMDEFAEEHIVNGVTVKAVLEGLTMKEYVQYIGRRSSLEDINARTVMLHIRKSDIREVVHGNVIEIDGEMYSIVDVTDDMGLLTLTLEAGTL